MKTVIVLAALLALMLVSLVGCNASSTITDLQVTLDAISAGFPIIAGLAGVPPEVVSRVVTYLDQTNDALAQSSVILAGPGTDAQKAAQIAAAFVGIVAPDLPAQYSSLVSLVATVIADVARFLASFSTLQPATSTSAHVSVLSAHDKALIAACQQAANKNRVGLAALKGR